MFGYKYRYFFILLLTVYSFVNIIFTEGQKLIGVEVKWYLLLAVISAMVVAVWETNRAVEGLAFVSGKIKSKLHPLIVFFLFSLIAVAVIAAIVASLCVLLVKEISIYKMLIFKLCLGFGFRINLFLHCINAIFFFSEKLKKSQVEAESFKKKTIEARFEALRSQLNPHFLFNSLNVLSTLVFKDADISAKFIDQLAKVYRYLLYYQEKKIVTLQEELEFLKAYIYLLKIRFSENLFIHLDIPPEKLETYIAPATLQLLIENAIKHNIVSAKNPLKIKIYINELYLIVENNLQEKSIKEPSTSIGLANINNRYEFISSQQVEIIRSEGVFRVKIPLIQLTDI